MKKNRERKIKEKQEKVAAKPAPAAKPAITTIQDRRHLHNYRVIQRNLVYVIGLPGGLGSEDLLRKAEYFGQYGKIGKIVIHRNHSGAQTRYVDVSMACGQLLWAERLIGMRRAVLILTVSLSLLPLALSLAAPL